MHKIGNWRNQLEILRLGNLLDRSLLWALALLDPFLTGPYYWTLTGPY